jgi:hypothetical protein
MISDQIPTKLAPDTIKNTNLKIVHRTVAADDRETMGRAMNMNEAQMNYLSSLSRGYAAVYAEGDNKPKCVKMPLVKLYYRGRREDVVKDSQAKVGQLPIRRGSSDEGHGDRRYRGCAECANKCDYYAKAAKYIDSQVDTAKVLQKWARAGYKPGDLEALLNTQMMRGLDKSGLYKRLCIIGYILSKGSLSEEQRQECISTYIDFYNRHLGGK